MQRSNVSGTRHNEYGYAIRGYADKSGREPIAAVGAYITYPSPPLSLPPSPSLPLSLSLSLSLSLCLSAVISRRINYAITIELKEAMNCRSEREMLAKVNPRRSANARLKEGTVKLFVISNANARQRDTRSVKRQPRDGSRCRQRIYSQSRVQTVPRKRGARG